MKKSNTHNRSKASEAAIALKAFFKICALWHLSNAHQIKLLGSPAERTFYDWKEKKDGRLGRDVLERISYILGIFKALQILFPDSSLADTWVKKPNLAPIFNGTSALDRMLLGNVSDLLAVRQYLDAQRGGWA